MFEKLPVPSKGDKLRASWGAGVTNRVNELGAMAPAGMLSRDGQTGTGFAPLPANLRDRRGSSAVRHWVYVPSPEPDEGSEEEPPKAKWTNCVVQLGFRAGLKLDDFELEEDMNVAGVFAIEVNLRTASTAGEGFEIKRYEDEYHIPAPDIANDKVYVYIGKVEEKENADGETELVQTDGIYSIPVIYKYV